MAKDDVLYANPANYVVDVIGAGIPLPTRGGSGYRRLTADEWTLLQNCPECVGALNQAKWINNSPINAYGQHTSQVQFAQFSCMGMQFIRVANPAIPGPAITSVWNHPAPLQVTGLKGLPMKRTNTPHWPGLGEPDLGDVEIGTPNNDMGIGAYAALPNPNGRPEISAAVDLLAYFDVNGCSRSSLPVVTAFQNAYNASGLPGQLTLDGEYGPNTQRALQNVMDEAQADAGAGPSQQAPANCFPEYGQVPSIPALDRPASTPATPSGTYTAPVTTVVGDTGKKNTAMLLIGGAVAAVAAGGGYLYYKKHRRGR